jgi:integrase
MTDLLLFGGTKDGNEDPAPQWERIKLLVLRSLGSSHSKRVFGKGLDLFLSWCRTAGRLRLEQATVQEFRASLEARLLASSTVNVYLSVVRKLAAECATEGWLDPQQAAAIARVKGPRSQGVRSGHWLTPEEASRLLSLPDVATPKGSRDRAVLALLLGCGLRRAELCRLRLRDLQLRDGRWVIPDLVGKGKRFRTVPVPTWVKDSVDHWAAQAGITEGRLFRAVNKGGTVWGEGISEDTIWAIAREYGAKSGQPELAPHHLRRTCARLCRVSGGALEQIQLLLGHSSIQTTERYLGTRQELVPAVNDNLPITIPAAGKVLAIRKAPQSERGGRVLAAAVPGARLPATRAIDDTRRLP